MFGTTPMPTLTIAPGTQVLFAKKSAMTIGFNPKRPGVLIAKGTSTQPIVFNAGGDVDRTYGFWCGLHFWSASGSQLDYVNIVNGGAIGDTSQGVLGDGDLNVHREIGAFMTHSNLSYADGCAVTTSDGTRPGTNAVTTNFLDASLGNTLTKNIFNKQCTY